MVVKWSKEKHKYEQTYKATVGRPTQVKAGCVVGPDIHVIIRLY